MPPGPQASLLVNPNFSLTRSLSFYMLPGLQPCGEVTCGEEHWGKLKKVQDSSEISPEENAKQKSKKVLSKKARKRPGRRDSVRVQKSAHKIHPCKYNEIFRKLNIRSRGEDCHR